MSGNHMVHSFDYCTLRCLVFVRIRTWVNSNKIPTVISPLFPLVCSIKYNHSSDSNNDVHTFPLGTKMGLDYHHFTSRVISLLMPVFKPVQLYSAC